MSQELQNVPRWKNQRIAFLAEERKREAGQPRVARAGGGESAARRDGEQMGLHLHPPTPQSQTTEPPERERNIWSFSGAGVCRTVLGFLRQILQICPIVFHVVGRVSAAAAAAAAARPRRAEAVSEAVGDRPQLVHVHSSL